MAREQVWQQLWSQKDSYLLVLPQETEGWAARVVVAAM